jgi:hypothetical protein
MVLCCSDLLTLLYPRGEVIVLTILPSMYHRIHLMPLATSSPQVSVFLAEILLLVRIIRFLLTFILTKMTHGFTKIWDLFFTTNVSKQRVNVEHP